MRPTSAPAVQVWAEGSRDRSRSKPSVGIHANMRLLRLHGKRPVTAAGTVRQRRHRTMLSGRPRRTPQSWEGTELTERSGDVAENRFGGRPPTSHERLTGLPWDASYRNGPAPWDIGKPQPAVVRLASLGAFAGAVLDAGCGTGDNAL